MKSYTSELAEWLETAGLVKARRQGKTKQIRLSDAKALELLANLTQQYSHIDWPELLSGAALPICYCFNTPRTATDLAHGIGMDVIVEADSLEAAANQGSSSLNLLY